MADYTPVASLSKPPQAMTLAEMMNFANSAQAYQQAQKINPLQVQQYQQIVEQAKTMNPELLQQARQTSRIGELALDVDEQKNLERRNLQTFFSNPNNFQTNGRIDLDKINMFVPKIAPLTGADAISKYSTLGEAQTQAISAKQNLTKDQRSMIAQRFDILGRLGVQDKNAYIKEMDLMKQENPENSDLHQLLDSYKTIWGHGMESGPDLPKKAIAGAAALLTPEQQQTQFSSKSAIDAQGRVVTTTPDITGGKPKVEVSIPQGLQSQTTLSATQGGNTTAAAGSEVAPEMRLPYPTRRADQPYTAMPTEEKDQATGFDYRNNLVNAQIGLPQARRNTEEVMKSANEIASQLFDIEKQGGFVGNVGRKIRSAIGSDKYDLLTKDLAQQAITQSKTMGSLGVTVGGLDMQAVANGTVKIPPDVLVTIAKRIEADRTNMDMQANGAQNFFQKFGDNNQKAFIQAWNANAKDTRIFEAINAMKNETDPIKMQNDFKRLFPKQSEFEDALTRYQNLKSLEATGVPIKPLKAVKR